MMRTVVLLDERDRPIGRAQVPELTFVIKHDDRFFVRTDKGARLAGGGIGAVFVETEVIIRNKLGAA